MSNAKKLSESLAVEFTSLRTKKINAIKKKISSGAYKVKSDSIAKALVGKQAQ